MTATNWLRGQTLVADELDAAFGRCIDRAGDAMSGLLTLYGDPSNAMDAATKQYVDNGLSGALGIGYLPLTGGTITGTLNLTGAGTALDVTNNARTRGTHTFGAGANNILTITPGAASASLIAISQSGTGGISFGTSTVFGGNFRAPTGTANLIVSPGTNSGTITFGDPALGVGSVGVMTMGATPSPPDGSTGGKFVVTNIVQSPFFRTPGNTYTGANTAVPAPMFISANFAGTMAAGSASQNSVGVFNTSSDTANVPAGLNGIPTFKVTHNYGGVGTSGGRAAAQFSLTNTAAITGDLTTQQYTVSNHWFASAFNVGGTPGVNNQRGYAYGTNPQVLLQPGATYWQLANALGEVDMGVVGTTQPATISGSVTTGDTVSLTFTSAAITGSPVTVSYTTGAANTLNNVAAGLQAAIWNNIALRNAGFSATIANQTPNLTLTWPLDTVVTVSTATSGAATETVALGSVTAGASVNTKYGMSIIRLDQDTAPPIGNSYAIEIGSGLNSPAAGWQGVLNIGGGSSQWPLSPTATIIGATPQLSAKNFAKTQPMPPNIAAWGIDWTNIAFSSGSLRMPGLTVDGSGKLSVGNTAITTTSGIGGTSIDATGWIGTGNPAIASSGGAGSGNINGAYYPGDVVFDDLGGIYTVTTTNPATSGVTGLLTTTQPSAPTGSAPANPRQTTGGSGQGLTVNITWTATTTLSLNPSGGPIKMALLTNAANDAAASGAGVPVGGIYRNGSVMMQRVA